MKKSLVTVIALLMVTFAILPVSAQSIKVLNADVKYGKNPVRYAVTAAFSDGRGVYLEWKTEIESKNLGFYIYRVVDGETKLVSPALIAGAYLQARDERITTGSYSYFDRFGDINSTYIIESLNVSGRRHNSNLIQTQFVNDLTTVAGISSEEFDNQARNASPVIERNSSVLPVDLQAEVDANTLEADPEKQLWVAAQPGVKIGVKAEGLYRVSRASLQAGGFNVNAPTNLWQLYVNGVEQAIIVGNNGEYIEFYGKGIDTLDSDTQIYFLVVGTENGKRIGSTFRRRVGGSEISQNYAQTYSKKERFSYSSNFLNGDQENFFGSVATNSGGAVFLNLTGVDFSVPNSSIEVTIQGLTEVSHQTKIFLNNVELGTVSNINYGSTTRIFNISTSILREGFNELKIITLNGSGDITVFGGLKINFARQYRAEQNKVSFYVPNFKTSYADGFTSPNVRVFDTTNPDNPLLITGLTIEPNGSTYRVLLPSNRGRVMFALEDSAVLQPASIVQNTPSSLSSADNGGLIIITHKDWLTQAEDWANYRRAQGAVVKVVNVEDIFDEFNFGVLKPDSIRSFLQHAKNNWQTPPNYVLLLGDGTYDPRNHLGNGNFNYVPTRLVDTIYTETGSDDTLADFNDDGLSEIAIGRIPARNAATVTLVLGKMMAFEQGLGQTPLSRGVIFASDLPNGYDFEGLSARLANQLPGSVPKIMVNRGQADANAQLVNQMNTGRFIVNYSGHGSATFWAASNFFGSTHATQLVNSSNNLSIFTMLTCLNGYFIQPTDSLSEFLLKNPNGGAVATWASSGLTTPDIQEIMATRFYNQVAAGNIPRFGDLIRDAKTTINFGRDVRLSWVLLGDPMLKVK